MFLTPDSNWPKRYRSVRRRLQFAYDQRVQISRLNELGIGATWWWSISARATCTVEAGCFIQEVTSVMCTRRCCTPHEDTPGLNLKVMELGAYDSITHPPNMIELRLILRRPTNSRRRKRNCRACVRARRVQRASRLAWLRPAMRSCLRWRRRSSLRRKRFDHRRTGTARSCWRGQSPDQPASLPPGHGILCANLPDTLIEDECSATSAERYRCAGHAPGRLEMADQQSVIWMSRRLGIGAATNSCAAAGTQFRRLGGNTTVSVNIR